MSLLLLRCIHRCDLVETAGATMGLHLLATLFFDAGDVAFVEEATYYHATTLLANDCGLRVIPGTNVTLILAVLEL